MNNIQFYDTECFALPLTHPPRPPEGQRFCAVCLTPFAPRTKRHLTCSAWCGETRFEVMKVLHRMRMEEERAERFRLTGSTRKKRRKRRRRRK